MSELLVGVTVIAVLIAVSTTLVGGFGAYTTVVTACKQLEADIKARTDLRQSFSMNHATHWDWYLTQVKHERGLTPSEFHVRIVKLLPAGSESYWNVREAAQLVRKP